MERKIFKRNGNEVRRECNIRVEEKCVDGAGIGHDGCLCSGCVTRKEEKVMLQQLNDKLVRILEDRDNRFRELCNKYNALKECRKIIMYDQ